MTAGRVSPADGKRLGEQMSKIIGGVLALAGLCALSMFLLSCGSTSSRPAGVLYVVNQGLNGSGNSISSFGINLDNGELQYLNSNASTCPTQPTSGNSSPCGLPVDVLLDPTGATAFVLNQGVQCPEVLGPGGTQWVCQTGFTPVPPAIYPYTVNSDGSLAGPGPAVVWSCGLSVSASACNFNDTAVHLIRDDAGQFLFVIDSGSYPWPGSASPTPYPPVYPSCPHTPTGPTDVCPSITVFAMTPGSTTLKQLGNPFYLDKIPTGLSLVTSPSTINAQELLFLSNNQDICTASCIIPPNSDNTVSVFTVSSSGALTKQPNSPYIVAATNPVSVRAVNTNQTDIPNSGGLFVYVGTNTQTGGDVYPFEICTVVNAYCTQQDVDLAILTPLQACTTQCIDVAPTAAGLNPVQMLVDPTNNFLYVLSEGSSQLFGFKINTSQGTLTALAPASQPTGSQPVSMALHASVNSQGQNLYSASGQFIYVANTLSSNLTAFGLSTANGTISTLGTQIAPAAPSGVAVH